MRRGSIALVLAALAFAPALEAADGKAAGRARLRKATGLANRGLCRAALPEFTRAYEALKDPAILFNRAECYRKTGDTAAAVEDYKQFLLGIPKAPNRAQVEARIVELEGGGPPPAPEKAAPPEGKPPTAPAPAPEPLLEMGSAGSLAPPAAPLPPPVSPSSLDVMKTAGPSTDDRGGSGRVWIWTGVALVLAAGAAAGWYFFLKPGETDVPETALGSYKF